MTVTVHVRVLRRLLLWGAVLLPAAAIGAAFVVHGWPAQRFLALYVAPLWVRVRLGESGLTVNEHSAIDGAVLLLAFLRFCASCLAMRCRSPGAAAYIRFQGSPPVI